MRASRLLESGFWAVGLALLFAYGALRVHSTLTARGELERFERAKLTTPDATLATGSDVDTTLWSEQRVQAYRESLATRTPAPVAVLRIPRLSIRVPVLPGTDDVVLDRGVGHIEGTARPGAAGNVGIAGHRDGFFRGLKDIAAGDLIELETLDGTRSYVVSESSIVEPGDVEVLDPTAEPSVTLVTCYPFYFAGSAPQRFVVRGVEVSSIADATP